MELDFTTYDESYAIYEKKFSYIADVAKKILKIKCDPIISVSLIDNENIHEINKIYRNVDRETDVISFAFLDDKTLGYSLLKKKGMVVLGDIYISIEKAITQAQEIGNTLDRELCFLFTHGLCHLLGYDHMKKEDEEIMFPLQEKILMEAKDGLSKII